MKLTRKCMDLFDRVNNFMLVLAGILVLLVMLITCAEILMRYLLNRPIFWATEITEYSLLFITFLGSAWLLGKDGHVRMDLLVNALNPKARTFAEMSASIIGTVISLVFFWYGVKVTWANFQQHTVIPSTLEPPFYLVLAIIPIGSLLLAIQFLRRAFGDFERLRLLRDEKQG